MEPLIPKESSSARARLVASSGSWLLSASFVLLIAVVVLAGGLVFYRRSLASVEADWAKQIAAQEAELKPDLLDQLITLSDSLAAARGLLANHDFVSNVFLLMEETTHPKVQFTSFTVAVDSQKIDLSGTALSYGTVSQQIQLLESHPQIGKVDFGGLSRGDQGLVSFKLAVMFKPSVLRLRSQ